MTRPGRGQLWFGVIAVIVALWGQSSGANTSAAGEAIHSDVLQHFASTTRQPDNTGPFFLDYEPTGSQVPRLEEQQSRVADEIKQNLEADDSGGASFVRHLTITEHENVQLNNKTFANEYKDLTEYKYKESRPTTSKSTHFTSTRMSTMTSSSFTESEGPTTPVKDWKEVKKKSKKEDGAEKKEVTKSEKEIHIKDNYPIKEVTTEALDGVQSTNSISRFNTTGSTVKTTSEEKEEELPNVVGGEEGELTTKKPRISYSVRANSNLVTEMLVANDTESKESSSSATTNHDLLTVDPARNTVPVFKWEGSKEPVLEDYNVTAGDTLLKPLSTSTTLMTIETVSPPAYSFVPKPNLAFKSKLRLNPTTRTQTSPASDLLTGVPPSSSTLPWVLTEDTIIRDAEATPTESTTMSSNEIIRFSVKPITGFASRKRPPKLSYLNITSEYSIPPTVTSWLLASLKPPNGSRITLLPSADSPLSNDSLFTRLPPTTDLPQFDASRFTQRPSTTNYQPSNGSPLTDLPPSTESRFIRLPPITDLPQFNSSRFTRRPATIDSTPKQLVTFIRSITTEPQKVKPFVQWSTRLLQKTTTMDHTTESSTQELITKQSTSAEDTADFSDGDNITHVATSAETENTSLIPLTSTLPTTRDGVLWTAIHHKNSSIVFTNSEVTSSSTENSVSATIPSIETRDSEFVTYSFSTDGYSSSDNIETTEHLTDSPASTSDSLNTMHAGRSDDNVNTVKNETNSTDMNQTSNEIKLNESVQSPSLEPNFTYIFDSNLTNTTNQGVSTQTLDTSSTENAHPTVGEIGKVTVVQSDGKVGSTMKHSSVGYNQSREQEMFSSTAIYKVENNTIRVEKTTEATTTNVESVDNVISRTSNGSQTISGVVFGQTSVTENFGLVTNGTDMPSHVTSLSVSNDTGLETSAEFEGVTHSSSSVMVRVTSIKTTSSSAPNTSMPILPDYYNTTGLNDTSSVYPTITVPEVTTQSIGAGTKTLTSTEAAPEVVEVVTKNDEEIASPDDDHPDWMSSTQEVIVEPEDEDEESHEFIPSCDEVPAYVRLTVATSWSELCRLRRQLREAIVVLLRKGRSRDVIPEQVLFLNLGAMQCKELGPTPKEHIALQVYLTNKDTQYDQLLTNDFLLHWHKTRLHTDFNVEKAELVLRDRLMGGIDMNDNSSVIAAIAISCVAAVCLLLLGILLLIIRKRQKGFNYGQRCTPVSLDDYSLDNISVYNSVRRKGALRGSKRSYGNPAFDDPDAPSHCVNFAGLASFSGDRVGLDEEFAHIPSVVARPDELPPGVETKNRYANVIPLPETRVQLGIQESTDPVDIYINANYVKGPKGVERFYIACQAPLQSTVTHFWTMVWEQQVKVVLMLTNLEENGVEKCADYLPPSEVLDCHRVFGDFQVTLKKREVREKYIISSLQLKNMENNLWREVTHMWFASWPAQGVPDEPSAVIAFLIEARSFMKSRGDAVNPTVVHCSPGTGRTGTVIAVDLAIRDFETVRSVDIPKTVYALRRQRAGAVQTRDQYAFIYKVLNLYATKLTGGSLDSI